MRGSGIEGLREKFGGVRFLEISLAKANGAADAVSVGALEWTGDIGGVGRGAGRLASGVTTPRSSSEIVLRPLLLALCGRWKV